MAATFDATVGGAAANSYVTVDYADDYALLRIGTTAWAALTTANKQAYLVTATRMLETYFAFRGNPADESQALHWPAVDDISWDTLTFDSDTIPEAVKRATCEQALYLLRINAIEDPTAIMAGLASVQVGAIEVEFDKSMTPDQIPGYVAAMLARYGTMVAGARKYGVSQGSVSRA